MPSNPPSPAPPPVPDNVQTWVTYRLDRHTLRALIAAQVLSGSAGGMSGDGVTWDAVTRAVRLADCLLEALEKAK